MRRAIAALFALACLAGISGCSHAAPPVGRWEGIYDTNDTIVAARVEITAKGDIYLSAPDAMGVGGSSDEDRAAIRQRLADGLSESWGSVAPRRMDFDGKTFRKPGGIAPQLEWDGSHMTAVFYLGTRPAIRVRLRAVSSFDDNLWND